MVRGTGLGCLNAAGARHKAGVFDGVERRVVKRDSSRRLLVLGMALAVRGGLLAATVLTITFLSALYALAFRVNAPARSDLVHSPQPNRQAQRLSPALLEAGE